MRARNPEKYSLTGMINNETKHISELISGLMQERSVNVDKLALVTNIPRRFISALIEGDFKRLPAKPYVRGYLTKIAAALNIEPAFLLKAYKDTTEMKGSGEKDTLPVNRFAIQRINKNFVIVVLLIIIVVGFLTFRMKDILGTPSLEVGLPENTLVTKEEVIKVAGSINPKDRLTLNQEIVYTDEAGKFEKEISLSPGLNTLEFDVKRFLGRETKVIRQIFYEKPVSPIEILQPNQ